MSLLAGEPVTSHPNLLYFNSPRRISARDRGINFSIPLEEGKRADLETTGAVGRQLVLVIAEIGGVERVFISPHDIIVRVDPQHSLQEVGDPVSRAIDEVLLYVKGIEKILANHA